MRDSTNEVELGLEKVLNHSCSYARTNDAHGFFIAGVHPPMRIGFFVPLRESQKIKMKGTMMKKLTLTPKLATLLRVALSEWVNLQNRSTNPVGDFDKQGRWYPSEHERCSCCDAIRSPSKAFPYSYMTHCRSAEHVANRHKMSEEQAAIFAGLTRRKTPAAQRDYLLDVTSPRARAKGLAVWDAVWIVPVFTLRVSCTGAGGSGGGPGSAV